jgi:ADP-ribose pyrophosphatase
MTRQVVFHGVKIQVAQDRETLPDGRLVQRDVVLHPGAVVILPLVGAGRVCLLRNRRPIVGETLLELPAGTLEPGEDPAAAAVRELAEETGYRAKRWRKLTEFYPSPGVLSERSRLYLAEELTPGTPNLEPDEEIVAEVVDWDRAVGWCLDGTIRDAKTLVGLLLWDRLRTK